MLFKNTISKRIFTLLIAPVCILSLLVGSFLFWGEDKVANAAWYNSNWEYRIKLTVNAEKVMGGSTTTELFLTSGTSWTVPDDWNSTENTIECIGAGGNGGNGSTGGVPASGGGGGAYAKVTNVSLTAGGSVSYVVAAGGSQGDTYFNGVASSSATLSCAGGRNGSAGASVAGGAGGTVANSTGSTEYAGGTGGQAPSSRGGAGGGGSAGPSGAGKTGGRGSGTSSDGGGGGGSNGGSSTAGSNGASGTGGAGGAGTGGTGGGAGGSGSPDVGDAGTNGGGGGGGAGTNASATAIAGGNGGSDTAFDATHGAGGGGGAGSGSQLTGSGGNGGTGGTYGGGGGGAGGGSAAGGTGGTGGQGLIVINYTPQSHDDFPVYVDLSDLPQHVWDNMRSDCGDIRITTTDGSTEVPREIVSCDSGTQTGELHFKAPSITGYTDTVFYIYYGNAAQGDYAESASYGAQNVWTNGFVGVWHLGEDGNTTSGGYKDSTSNNGDGTGVSMTASSDVSGTLASGQDFDGSADRITVPRSNALEPTSAVSMSLWLKRDGAQVSSAKPVWYGDNASVPYGPYGFEANADSDTDICWAVSSASTHYQACGSSLSNDRWTHFGGTFDGTTRTLYQNGVSITSTVQAFTIGDYDTDGLAIGDRYDTGLAWNGAVDELRISNVARSSGWVQTEFNNQVAPSSFYFIGEDAQDTVTVYLTSGTSWSVPSNWNNDNNTIEVIGGGGSGGVSRVNNTRYATGGGGGGYAKAVNVALSGTVTYAIGSGGTAVSLSVNGNTAGNAGGDTYLCNSTSNCASIAGTAVVVGAKGGGGGLAANSGTVAGGAGGAIASAVGGAGGAIADPGVYFAFAGGSGGTVSGAGVSAPATGGGGAAGPYGAGNNGVNMTGDGASSGGSGGAGYGGAANGGNGTEWSASYGSGGGGGGARPEGTSGTAGSGGNYGGAGGGVTGYSGTQTSGTGIQGLIVIKYSPLATSTPAATVFDTTPNNTSSSSISMVAATTTDQGGSTELESGTYFEYYFDATSCGSNNGTGGTDSGWIATTTYTDTGLQPNKCYGYTITVRDGLSNTGATSTASTTYTSAAVPGPLTFSAVTGTTFDLLNNAGGNPGSSPTTTFAVQISSTSPTDAVWLNKYVDASGNPSATAVWLEDGQIDGLTVSGLDPLTYYEVRVKARNFDAEETSWSSLAATTTVDGNPPTPNPPYFQSAPTNISHSAISMTAVTGSDPEGSTPLEYNFEVDNTLCGANAGGGAHDSGWQTSDSYTDSGLETNKCYGYTVSIRDAGGNVTSVSSASTTYTGAATPGAPTLAETQIYTGTIVFDSRNVNGNPSSNPTTEFAYRVSATSPTDATWDGLYIDAGGNPSATAVWLSDSAWGNVVIQGVASSTQYQIQAKARNEDGDETPFGASGSVTTAADTPKDVRLRGGIRLKGDTTIR